MIAATAVRIVLLTAAWKFFVSPAPVAIDCCDSLRNAMLALETAACLQLHSALTVCGLPSVLQAASSPQESFKLWRQEEDIVARLQMASQFRSALGLRALPRVVIISERLPIGACRAACAKPSPLLPVAAFCYALPRPSHG